MQNVTRGTQLGCSIELADTSAKRRTGLLSKSELAAGEGIWITPCEAVHCFFMKFAIDVLFLDRKRIVRKAVAELRPWRVSGCLVAHSTLELPSGAIRSTGTRVGDQLEFSKISSGANE